MKFSRNVLVLMGVISLLFVSCHNNKKNKLDIELPKDAKIDVKIYRYDKVLMNLNVDNLKNELKQNKKDYMLFLDANLDDTLNILRIYNFIKDPATHEIYDAILKKYSDVKWLENDLGTAFTYLKHYFPNKAIPKVYSYHSFMDYQNRIIYLDTVMAIALDMYLGKDFKLYPSVEIPKYLAARLDSNYIIADCMSTIAEKMVKFDPNGKSLLDFMIDRGKVLYIEDALIPKVADEIKIGYTKEQIEWCKKNEANIWSFFIKNNLLYCKDFHKIRPFVSEGPKTNGFPGSPPRMADWVGWQIVKYYMDNKKTDLNEMINLDDSQAILQASKYKPQK